MNPGLLAGACLVMVASLAQASAASSPTGMTTPGQYADRLSDKAAPTCRLPSRSPRRYVGEYRFLPNRSGEVAGRFGRLSWSGAILEYRVAAGFLLEVCASTRGGGMQYSETVDAVGPRDGRINLDEQIDMVGFGVVRTVPSSVTSGL
jgi:hypothetical protein